MADVGSEQILAGAKLLILVAEIDSNARSQAILERPSLWKAAVKHGGSSRVTSLFSPSDVGEAWGAAARPAFSPAGKKRVQLRSHVLGQFVAAVFHPLGV